MTGDYDKAPDIDVLCEAIESAMAELVGLATPARQHTDASSEPA